MGLTDHTVGCISRVGACSAAELSALGWCRARHRLQTSLGSLVSCLGSSWHCRCDPPHFRWMFLEQGL